MKKAQPATVTDYLGGLPDERRAALVKLRALVRKNLPKGYKEQIGYGMICYVVPLPVYPETYNGEPLCYLALASQKNHMAIYTMGLYSDPDNLPKFREGFRKAGRKLDMGKSCIRFKRLDDLPLDVIAWMVAATPMKEFIAAYERARHK